MKKPIAIGFAQLNFKVGDLKGNAEKIKKTAAQAYDNGVQVLVLPELALTGYPPEDLLLRPQFIRDQNQVLQTLCQELAQFKDMYVLVGHLTQDVPQQSIYDTPTTYNTASLVQNGVVVKRYFKRELPNYGVFDEKRYYTSDTEPLLINIYGHCFAVAICEDVWFPNVAKKAADLGASTLLILNASPFALEKTALRMDAVRKNVSAYGLAAIYCNLVGGQDELVFDGESFALDHQGSCVSRLSSFQEVLGIVQIDIGGQLSQVSAISIDKNTSVSPYHNENECVESLIWRALVLATRDYLHKNGFKSVVLGLSGGIDSAVVLAVAVDAIGAENVRTLMMPTRYTAGISLEDATDMANRLNIQHDEVIIESLFNAFNTSLEPIFNGLAVDVTEENMQARIRGTLLMAMSNKFGSMVLTTGNKSELATGYCTLYGDMNGGFAVLKDVPKTMVYRLAKWRNLEQEVIPERIITRPPSAELRPDQKDQDSLPDYDTLDAILERVMVHNQSSQAIIDAGFKPEDVTRVINLLRINEYKRRQGAPGPKITARAFGRDWRYPITSGYRI